MTEIQLPDRALRLVDGAPDVSSLPCDRLLDEGGAEYMRRFHISRERHSQWRRFHLISADDPGRDFHDHPWDYITRLLSGSYIEHTPDGDTEYGPGDVLVRKAEQLHRLELADGPVWTYFVTGRFRRPWGFATPSGWVPHGKYAAAGRVTGCGPGRAFLSPGRPRRSLARRMITGGESRNRGNRMSDHVSGPRRAMHRYDDDLVALVCHYTTLGMQEVHALMRLRAEGESGPVGGPFATMPRDLQDAAVDGVERARRNGQLNARDHHNAWVDFLLDRGWRHGPRDYEEKQHPALVYWPQLPPEDRDKARVFLSVVMGLTLDVEAA